MSVEQINPEPIKKPEEKKSWIERLRNEPSYMFMGMALVLLVVVIGLLGYVSFLLFGGSSADVEPSVGEAAAIVEATQEPAPEPTAVPVVAEVEATQVVAEEEEPTEVPASPVPTDPPANLVKIGLTARGDQCLFFTDMVVEMLENEMQIDVSRRFFESPEELLDALSMQEIDFTVCYRDPVDRSFLRPRLGQIRQIGASYWEGEDSKLQIWANGTSKANLRNEHPCALALLETMVFTDLDTSEASNGGDWVRNNPTDVNAWIQCRPEN